MSIEISDDVINKGIAEFMGAVWCENIVDQCQSLTFDTDNLNYNYYCSHLPITRHSYRFIPRYTESLDALVPVVEKLYKDSQYELDISFGQGCRSRWRVDYNNFGCMKVFDKSPSRALALVIYKVLEGEKNER